MENILFSPLKVGLLEFKNKAVMAPMTRSRASKDNIPDALMAQYYGQRAGAGLIITEGTSPSANGVGYARIPGVYNEDQVKAWKKITDAVHVSGGKIFMQLMHCGRVAHQLNLPEGAEVLAPSAIAAKGDMYTDSQGMVPLPVPKAMTIEKVKVTIDEYVQAAVNAVQAGFDGVEFHGANGYLMEQFLNPNSNQRTDAYGGSIENRCRFIIEVIEKAVKEIGKEKIGVRFSPYGSFNDMQPYNEVENTYSYLADKLNELGILYLHILDHGEPGKPTVPQETIKNLRSRFLNLIILCGSFDAEKANKVLQNGTADLVAFGKPYLANPDLVKRYEKGAALNTADPATFYTPGEKGYTDYPFMNQ